MFHIVTHDVGLKTFFWVVHLIIKQSSVNVWVVVQMCCTLYTVFSDDVRRQVKMVYTLNVKQRRVERCIIYHRVSTDIRHVGWICCSVTWIYDRSGASVMNLQYGTYFVGQRHRQEKRYLQCNNNNNKKAVLTVASYSLGCCPDILPGKQKYPNYYNYSILNISIPVKACNHNTTPDLCATNNIVLTSVPLSCLIFNEIQIS